MSRRLWLFEEIKVVWNLQKEKLSRQEEITVTDPCPAIVAEIYSFLLHCYEHPNVRDSLPLQLLYKNLDQHLAVLRRVLELMN